MSDAGKPSFAKLIYISPEVELLLGVSAAKIRKMSLRALAELFFDKGLVPNVIALKTEKPPHLTITTTTDPPDELLTP